MKQKASLRIRSLARVQWRCVRDETQMCLPVSVVERLLGAEEVEQLLNVAEARHEDQHGALHTAVLW